MLRWLLPILLAPAVFATSVAPRVQECPVCGVMFVRMALCSYSQFGEPARNLADAPSFVFADVHVCPGDLYASWSDGWKKVQAVEKDRLSVFLQDPALHLTDKEKSIIAGHEEQFRQSDWLLPLWARTCDELRDLDERSRFDRQMWLYYAGSHAYHDEDAPKWQKHLASLHRENAISALKDAAMADWPTPVNKRIFAYLRAELTREAGRKAEALTWFREVIAAEKAAEPDNELEWISRWAEEQSLLCGSDAKESAKADDSPAEKASRDADSARKDREKSWRHDVLLPAVRKAVTTGGLPAVVMPVDDDPISKLPPLDDDSSEPAKRNFKELDRELYDLWQEQPPSARNDIARIYIRMLREYDETWESTQYPVMYFLPEIAETTDGRAAITRELDGAWKSPFWKTACAYAARMPESAEAFVRHPFSAKADTTLVVKLLVQRSDASWMDVAIKKLNELEWVSDEVIDYLNSLGLPEADAALDQAANHIRTGLGKKNAGNHYDGKLHTLLKIDELRVRSRLAKLPFR